MKTISYLPSKKKISDRFGNRVLCCMFTTVAIIVTIVVIVIMKSGQKVTSGGQHPMTSVYQSMPDLSLYQGNQSADIIQNQFWGDNQYGGSFLDKTTNNVSTQLEDDWTSKGNFYGLFVIDSVLIKEDFDHGSFCDFTFFMSNMSNQTYSNLLEANNTQQQDFD